MWALRSGVNILGWRTERDQIRYTTPCAKHTHTLHLSLTAEVVRGQNHSEWVYIKSALLRCTMLQIPSRSATKSYRRDFREEEDKV